MINLISKVLDKKFNLHSNGTNVSTEIIAGLTTFATMAYVLAVVPKMMGEAGLPTGPILTAMVLMIFLSSTAMGLYANRPFVLGPGIGSVAIFSITLIQLEHVSLGIACSLIFLSGLLFFLVTVFGIREIIVKIIPHGIKFSISASVGLFITVIGMRNAKIIAANAQKAALSFGDITQPAVLLAAVGFVILLILQARKIKGAALICIILTTALGIPFGITKLPQTIFSLPGGFNEIFFHFDLIGALNLKYVPFLFVFFLPDFFSSLGTAIGIGSKAGFLDKNGDFPHLNKVFYVDSVSAAIASLFSIPVMVTYLESGAGVEAGGRTGLTAITSAIAFLLFLLFTPLAIMIPSAATTPILVYVGVSMMSGMKNLNYGDAAEYIPAFLCVAFTAFTFNIANGISIAFISFVILKLAAGRLKELNIGHYLLALMFIGYLFAISAV